MIDLSDLTDFLGLLVAIWLLGVVAFLAVSAARLAWNVQPHHWIYRAGAVLLVLLAFGWVSLYIGDIPGVVSILHNHYEDIPPLSTLRSAVFDALLTIVGLLLLVLARGRVK